MTVVMQASAARLRHNAEFLAISTTDAMDQYRGMDTILYNIDLGFGFSTTVYLSLLRSIST